MLTRRNLQTYIQYIHLKEIKKKKITNQGKDAPAFKLRTMLNARRFLLLCCVRVIRAVTLGNMT